MLEIKLGLGLDGLRPHYKQPGFGVKELGPLGLLSVLETQCGLAPVSVTPTLRVLQYLSCLQASNHDARFYHDSLQADAFNVAKTLLHWRDTWYAHGWQGSWQANLQALAPRLQDLAEVELLAKSQVAANFGQRLQKLLLCLATQTTQITQITLLDPLSDFSVLWKQVLRHFPLQQAEALGPSARDENDLQRVQQTLKCLASGQLDKAANGEVNKTLLAGDASFMVLKADSKAVSAQLISQWLQQQQQADKRSEVALLASEDGFLFDNALHAANLPRLGFENLSPWRPCLQILSVALQLLWEPLNPQVLLEFLTLPVGPLPARIRYALAKVVIDEPGIDGQRWQDKLEELLAREGQRDAQASADLKQTVADWLACPRYALAEGIPLSVVLARVKLLALWLTRQQVSEADNSMRALFCIAKQHAEEFGLVVDNLMQQGQAVILPEQLNLLLRQMMGAGAGMSEQAAECVEGELPWLFGATQPESFYQPLGQVIWWDLQPASAMNYPWSKRELQVLRTQGVHLPDEQQQLQWQAQQWLKPLFAAQARLLIVVHTNREAQHPLWDQMNSCLSGWQELQVDDCVLQHPSLKQLDALSTTPVSLQPLAPVRRWWQLDSAELLSKRELESFSSLEHFLYSPYQWVLRYKADLPTNTLQILNDGNALKGILVHRLYQQFFTEQVAVLDVADDRWIAQWFEPRMAQLLRESGAVLLQPGRMIEKQQFMTKAKQSLQALLKQLRAAKVVTVQMETREEHWFYGGQLMGVIDMLVTNNEGQEAVIDIKWGSANYRKRSLEENQHLQLVTYGYLRHKNSVTGAWPSLAYFIIEGGKLLAQNHDYFPDAHVISASEYATQAQIWEQMQTTWQWRRAQLDQGRIELTVQGTEADSDSQPADDGLVMPDTSDQFNSYRILTGWDA